jgi:hypothetical protein
MAQDSEWITVKEMQRMLSIGRSTAYAICAQEEDIETAQIRATIRINRASLESWIRKQRYPKWREGRSTANKIN